MEKETRKSIGIVGGSAAGIYAAIFLKKNHPDYRVKILEKNDKLGKKVLATGNGHCNLFNLSLSAKDYNHPEFMEHVLRVLPPQQALDALRDLGIRILEVGDLVYPLSYSASTYVRLLCKILESLGVEVELNCRVLSYEAKEKVRLETDHGPMAFDEVIFAPGGKSQANLGSDGSLFSEFERHGYPIVPLEPSLCPVKTKERTKPLSGLRHKALVRLLLDDKTLYEENGEILFKDDGLSGIAIFNCRSVIARNKGQGTFRFVVDLFPEIPAADLLEDLLDAQARLGADYLDSYLEKPLKDYCLKCAGFSDKTPQNRCEIAKLTVVLKGMEFTYAGSYPFASSQVTCGGIALSTVDGHLHSLREKGVAFAGECLDIDGRCGGYNLGWALISSLLVAGLGK